MPLVKFKSIQTRWLVNTVGLVVLLLILAVIVFSYVMKLSYYSNIRNQLVTRAEASSKSMRSEVLSSPELMEARVAQVVRDFVDRDRLEMQFVDIGGVVKYTSSGIMSGFVPGTPDSAAAIARRETVAYDGADTLIGEKVMSISTPLYLANGQMVGTLRYITGLENVNRRVFYLDAAACGVALGILLAVLLSGMAFIRSIATPVRQITSVTRQIAEGQYGVTAHKRTDDEIGELCENINYMAAELSRTESAKNDFISSVSHELRTPLTAITGWAETLLTSEPPPEGIIDTGLKVIVKESVNLRHMVEELLDFSRIQSGRLSVTRTAIDVATELEDTVFLFSQRLKTEGLEVKYENKAGRIELLGDRTRLRQVFVNILDNARKNSPAGGIIEVYLELDKYKENALVIIRDYGSGIHPDDLPYIKQKFYKGRSKQPGTGIGLAVCDEIMRLHYGNLDIESELDEGTTVTISLPL